MARAKALSNVIGGDPGTSWRLGRNSEANGWTTNNEFKPKGVVPACPLIVYTTNLGSLKQMASTPSGAQFLGQNYNAAFFDKISKYGKTAATDFYNGGVYVGMATFTTNDATKQTQTKACFIPGTTSIGVGAFAGTTTKP